MRNSEIMQRSAGMTRSGEYHESKELSAIKGKMILARQFPRDPEWSMQSALRECARPELAAAAQYEFTRGDSVVKGPSIRLVEVLARCWGNVDYGVDEIEAADGSTTIKTYAWDLETNVCDEKTFSVRHERSTKKGTYKLTDSRDIYEMVANQGARRKRACILSVLPGWYVDAAVAACDKTLDAAMNKDGKSIEDHRAEMVAAFAKYEISREMIAAKVGKDIDKLDKQDIIKLSKLYSAINDGFVKPRDAFGEPEPDADLPSDAEAGKLDALNAELKEKITHIPLPWEDEEANADGTDEG